MAVEYKNFTTGGAGGAQDAQLSPAKRWWLLPKGEVAQAVIFVVTQLGQYDSRRQTQLQVSARLYGNLSLMGLNGLTLSKITSTQNAVKDRIAYNLVQSVTDTLVAKMAKNKPKPLYLTSGGDYKIQKRAKKLDDFTDGIFYENKAYEIGPLALRDGCWAGDGIVHVYDHYGRVKFERVMASELYVDQVESFYGNPRQLHRCKNVDREVLKELFPSSKAEIERANNASADLTGTWQNVADQVTVVESWHLPSGPNAKDGLHTICIEGDGPKACLLYETFTKLRFPFAFIKYSPRLYGFWGQGLVEQLQNIQLEINKLLWVIQRSMHMAGTFKILMENGSKIVKEHLNNDIGTIVCYTGQQPVYITPQMVQPEVYAHFQTLIQKGYEQAGISQLSASSQKPAGLDSGKALREYNDIESDRFELTGQSYENLFLDIADLAIDCARDIYTEREEYKVQVPQQSFIKSIDWKDIDLDRDEYVMKSYPVSSLPDDPSGRLQTIQEYMQAGMISPTAGRRLLDFPDLKEAEKLANSMEDYLNQIIEKMVDDGKMTNFEVAYDDANLAREIALEQYAYGRANGLEEEKLQLLRDFMDQITQQQQAAQAAMAPPQPQQPAGQPMANPMPAPQSDMLPNVNGPMQ